MNPTKGTLSLLALSLGLAAPARAQAPPPEYNRWIAAVDVQPTGASPDSFFDVIVDLACGRDQSTTTQLDLSTEVLVEVNGSAVASAFVSVLFDSPYDGCGPAGCANSWGCASLSVDGVLQLGVCKVVEHPGDDTLFCYCSGAATVPLLLVPAHPGDEITVILRPAPGALPELPGWEEDDEETLRAPLEGTRPFCFGDGSGTPCPCANHGGAFEGCENSTASGGVLFASGSVDTGADDLVLHAAQLPPSKPALLFYGTAWIQGGDGVPFGDGLRCVGGSVVRVGVKTTSPTGEASWGPGLAADEGFAPDDHVSFQAWYRDPGGPCATGFNLSNALDVFFE